ncbi:MAG: CvpA family protein [Lachnospiraceae bacterium]|nr:CvpA family protein [Lachnospiraceae bacterium]
MNELLIFTGIILLGFAVHGWCKGFVKTAFTFLLKIVTLVVGIILGPYITSFLFKDVVTGNGKLVNHVLVFIVLYVVIMIGIRILINSLNILAKLPVLKSMNRICGFAIGLVEGVFVLWIIFAIAVVISETTPGQWIVGKAMENELLTFLYENNLVSHIINDLFLKN